jgi:cytochrome c biogenesis protein CcdA
LWKRLPRPVYWIVGAAIAFIGAFVARGLSEQFAVEYRLAIWLAGSAVIFLGLWILSLGTKARLDHGRRDDSMVQ